MLLTPQQSRVLLRCALEHKFAILAVNADSPAAITDCLEAARECDAPIIIETSLWQLTGRSFGAGDALLANSERYRDVPVIYHTDHIKGPDTLRLLTAAIRGLPIGDYPTLLFGLPPSPAEVVEFEKSENRKPKTAVAELIAKLMKSPHFGEKWAWRDWVIAAFNKICRMTSSSSNSSLETCCRTRRRIRSWPQVSCATAW